MLSSNLIFTKNSSFFNIGIFFSSHLHNICSRKSCKRKLFFLFTFIKFYTLNNVLYLNFFMKEDISKINFISLKRDLQNIFNLLKTINEYYF